MGAVLAAATSVACAQRAVPSVVDPDVESTANGTAAELPPSGLGISTATARPDEATAAPVPTELIAPPRPLTLADGLVVGVFAEGLLGVRGLTVAGNGDVIVTIPSEDRIVIVPDRDRNRVADRVSIFAQGEPLNQPYGLVVRGDWLFVANTDSIVRFPYVSGDLVARGPSETLVGNLPGGGDHWARPLALSPDERLIVGIGSSCNACIESNPLRAALFQVDLSGGNGTLIAGGFRDPLGVAVHPETEEVWLTDAGRDDLGPALPPDELNRLGAGRDFGWPYCYGRQMPDPEFGSLERCAATASSALDIPPHSEPSGLVFYGGDMFPDDYTNDAIVALHGTLQRTLQSGYKVVRVRFQDGHPTGEVEDLVSGWLLPNTDRWGRPAALAQADDGALLLTDDFGGRIYRIAYSLVEPTPTPWR
jgi:glucose/arabinose dehydrogenase